MFVNSLHAQNFLFGSFTGDVKHISLFKQKLKEQLTSHPSYTVLDRSLIKTSQKEALISATGLASSDDGEMDYSIAKYKINCDIKVKGKNMYMAFLEIVNIQTSAIIISKTFTYEGDTFFEGMSRKFILLVNTYFKNNDVTIEEEINPHSKEPPLENKGKSIYKETENIWVENGIPAYDWETYYVSRLPFKQWSQSRSYNINTAISLATVPGYSGLNYVGEWGPGMFWTISEILILSYGLTKKKPLEQGIILGTLLPITILDIYFSKRKALQKNKSTNALIKYYSNNEFPYKFMEFKKSGTN